MRRGCRSYAIIILTSHRRLTAQLRHAQQPRLCIADTPHCRHLLTLHRRCTSSSSSSCTMSSSSVPPAEEHKSSSSSSSSAFPPWYGPHGPSSLRVLNSLTGKKEAFVPLHPPLVSWYICGPTVYDSAHLGHARAYVTFDILRRLLSDYFGFHVLYVMNVTDIDDKIILRARKRHLYDEYRGSTEAAGEQGRAALLSDIAQAYADGERQLRENRARSEQQLREARNSRQKEEMEERISHDEHKLTSLLADQAAFLASTSSPPSSPSSPPPPSVSALLTANASILSDHLDAARGHSVSEQSIFLSHAQRYEREFMEDMAALNVREPTVLTRVTEYVPEIISFVGAIVQQGHRVREERLSLLLRPAIHRLLLSAARAALLLLLGCRATSVREAVACLSGQRVADVRGGGPAVRVRLHV